MVTANGVLHWLRRPDNKLLDVRDVSGKLACTTRAAAFFALVACLGLILHANPVSSSDNNEALDVEIVKRNELKTRSTSIAGVDAMIGKEDVDEQDPAGGRRFTHGFVASFSVIIVSEIGDKTFFIAAIMSMQHPRMIVFAGAISALVFMTILSTMLGFAATIIPRAYTFYASTVLFVVFGLKMLYDGWRMKADEAQEEYREVQDSLKEREEQLERNLVPQNDVETGGGGGGELAQQLPWKMRLLSVLTTIFSVIFIEAFILTFLAEWGDRSQLATIILATSENLWGVNLGGFTGHALCTGLAVLGGRLISQKISARTVTIVGGVVFLLFAASALYIGP